MEFAISILELLEKGYVYYYQLFYYPLSLFLSADTSNFIASYLHLLLLAVIFMSRTWNVTKLDILLNYTIHIYVFLFAVFMSFMDTDYTGNGESLRGHLFIFVSFIFGLLSYGGKIDRTAVGINRYNEYYADKDDSESEEEIKKLKKKIKKMKKKEKQAKEEMASEIVD